MGGYTKKKGALNTTESHLPSRVVLLQFGDRGYGFRIMVA